MKNRLRMLAALLVGVAAMLGLAISSASSASAATVGGEDFTIVSTNAAATNNPVIANGVIHAAGVDHEINSTTDVFAFRRGSLLIRHHRIGRDHVQVDPQTCLATTTERGVYSIVAGSRAYRGATGRGTYRLSVLLIEPTNAQGRCLPNAAPTLFQEVVHAHGFIRLP